MKTNEINGSLENAVQRKTFGAACVGTCKEVLAQIDRVKETILAEARKTLRVHEQSLRLALNEAEALARQTLYPQLVFPDLAMEKIQGVARWNDRQRLLA
jgi:hypothetical protein